MKKSKYFIINPAIKYINIVILSNAKDLAFSYCYEILHCVQDDSDNCRVNNHYGNGPKLIVLLASSGSATVLPASITAIIYLPEALLPLGKL